MSTQQPHDDDVALNALVVGALTTFAIAASLSALCVLGLYLASRA